MTAPKECHECKYYEAVQNPFCPTEAEHNCRWEHRAYDMCVDERAIGNCGKLAKNWTPNNAKKQREYLIDNLARFRVKDAWQNSAAGIFGASTTITYKEMVEKEKDLINEQLKIL